MASKKLANDFAKLGKHVGECIKLVGKSVEILGAYAPVLDAGARRRFPKIRVGGAAIVPTIARLGKEHGLDSAKRPIDAMLENVARANAFGPLRETLRVCLQMVDDAIVAHNGEAWKTATFVYSMLRRMAKEDKALAVKIAPLAEFFAIGPRSNAAKAPKAPSPPVDANVASPNGEIAIAPTIGHA